MHGSPIHNPPHYNSRGGIEPIVYIRSNNMNYLEGCVVKYIHRAPFKGSQLQDLLKARQYLDWLIEEARDADNDRDGG